MLVLISAVVGAFKYNITAILTNPLSLFGLDFFFVSFCAMVDGGRRKVGLAFVDPWPARGACCAYLVRQSVVRADRRPVRRTKDRAYVEMELASVKSTKSLIITGVLRKRYEPVQCTDLGLQVKETGNRGWPSSCIFQT